MKILAQQHKLSWKHTPHAQNSQNWRNSREIPVEFQEFQKIPENLKFAENHSKPEYVLCFAVWIENTAVLDQYLSLYSKATGLQKQQISILPPLELR